MSRSVAVGAPNVIGAAGSIDTHESFVSGDGCPAATVTEGSATEANGGRASPAE